MGTAADSCDRKPETRYMRLRIVRVVRPAWAPLLCAPVLGLTLLGCGPGYTPEELAEATGQVREAYYTQDYYYGVELGDAWASRAPDAVELRAWTVANLVMTLREGEPRRMAEEMMATHPDSPWSWFALAHAIPWGYPRGNEREAMDAIQKAVAGLPGNPDPLILQAEILDRYADRETALAFLDGLDEPLRSNLDVRAFRVFRLAPPAPARTEADVESMINTYEDILTENQDHFLANYGVGRLLMGIEGGEERARPYLENAAALSPSPMPHYRLWRQIIEDPDLEAEARQMKVAEDFRYVLDNFPESPGRWVVMASDLDYLGFPDLQEELEGRVLRDHPESWAAERVLASRISDLEFEFFNEGPTNRDWFLEQAGRLEGILEEFVARPQHRDPSYVKDAYWTLFLLEKEKADVDLSRLGGLAETWAGYLSQVRDVWADQKCLLGAVSLAQHPQTLEAAKHLLTAGQEEIDKFLNERELQNERFSEVVFEAQESHIRSSNAYLSLASSLILAQEGSFEEAEAAISSASEFDPEEREALRILPLADFAAGTIKELRAEFASKNGDEATAQKFLTSAEQIYLRGMREDYDPRPRYGVGWTNPNETALEDLYEKRHGGLEGFEEYLAAAKEGDLDSRRAEILAARIDDPQPIVPFALKNLDGEEVTSESYLGKVVVVNFWGTW
jgi:hypothetical protein